MQATNDLSPGKLPNYFNLARQTPIVKKYQRPAGIAEDWSLTPHDLAFLKSFAAQPANERGAEIAQVYSLLMRMPFLKQFRYDRSKRMISQSLRTCSYCFLPADSEFSSAAAYPGKSCVVLEGTLAMSESAAEPLHQYQRLVTAGSVLKGTNTSIAITPVHLLVLDTKQCDSALRMESSSRTHQLLLILEKLLHTSRSEALWGVARKFQKVTFVKGQAVFLEGDPATLLYYIDSGEVAVSKKASLATNTNSAYPLKGNPLLQKQYTAEFTLSMIGPGTVFGAEEISCNEKIRAFSCHCTEESVLYQVSLSKLEVALEKSQGEGRGYEEFRKLYQFRQQTFNEQVKLFCAQNKVKPFTLSVPDAKQVSNKLHSKSQSVKYIYTPRAIEASAKPTMPALRCKKLNMSIATCLGERDSLDYKPPLKSVLKHSLSTSQVGTPVRPQKRMILRNHAATTKPRELAITFTTAAMRVIKRTLN